MSGVKKTRRSAGRTSKQPRAARKVSAKRPALPKGSSTAASRKAAPARSKRTAPPKAAKRSVAGKASPPPASPRKSAAPRPGKRPAAKGTKTPETGRKPAPAAKRKLVVAKQSSGRGAPVGKGKPAPKGRAAKPKAKREVERAIVRIRDLDPYRKCGPGTSVQRLIRVDEMVDRQLQAHLVFFDRHGWYCEHGQSCHAVGHARKHAAHAGPPAR